MNPEEVAQALGSRHRLAILRILSGRPRATAAEVHSAFRERFGGRHRESIYRDLERLVAAELVEKRYDAKRKALVYSLRIRSAKFVFSDGTVHLDEEQRKV